MYKPTRHSYEKRMRNQRRKAKAGLLLATTLAAGMAVNPCPVADGGFSSWLTGAGNISVVQAADSLSISKENAITIDLGQQKDKITDGHVFLTLDQDGTYILKGQNYMNDTWVDTQIKVPEGVTVNLILAEGFSIQNDDGTYQWGSGSWAGNSLTPFVIQGTANLYVEDAVTIANSVSDALSYGETWYDYYRGLFYVDGTMTIKEVKNGAEVALKQDVNCKEKWKSHYYDEETEDYNTYNNISAVFEGNGTVILEEGTYRGTEISYLLEGTTAADRHQGEAVISEKLTSRVKNLIICGGSYNDLEILKGYRESDGTTVQDGTLTLEGGSFTKIDGEYVMGGCSVKTPADADENFTVAKTNHAYAAPTYTWSADKSTCTASRVCGKDQTHVETETTDVTSGITMKPTCVTAGERTYTAKFKNAAFSTQTQTEKVAAVATAHTYGAPTYTWSADKSTCTASRVCKNNKSHAETEKATVTSKVTTEPTYDKTGVRTYTATFKNAAFKTQTQTESIAKKVKPQKSSIAKAKVSGISNKNYNGKSQKQSIKVRLGNKTLKNGTDYTVSYKNNKNIGKATVTIKGKGNYTGSIKKTFKITVSQGKTYQAGDFKYKMTDAALDGKGTVTITGTTKSKSNKKFKECKIADTVTIGGKKFKVTAIGDQAWKDYKKLERVEIGKNVKTIGKESFSGCKNVKTVVIKSEKLKTVGENAIKNIHKKAKITVPKDNFKAYKKLLKKRSVGFASGMTITKE